MMVHKIIEYIKHPSYLLIKLDNKRIITLSDKKYLELKYYKKFHKKLDFNDPKTFNEKLQWLKLYDRNPEYIKMVDKYEVKKYIKNIFGEKYIIPTLGVYEKFDDIDFDKLPNRFVIKCTHDSGGYVICKDKKNFNKKEARKKIIKSLKNNYYWSAREWPYKNVIPKIIVEAYMEDKIEKELIDYKLMCFNGKAKMLFTCTERFSDSGLKVTFFDMNWNKLPFERKYKSSNKNIKKPQNFDKMIKFSEQLAKNIPFVRVDWYEINGNLYFGELTFYPGAGYEEFTPEIWDLELGNMLDLKGVKK